MIRGGSRLNKMFIKEYLGVARIFAGYQVHAFQCFDRAECDVPDVPDRSSNDKKGPVHFYSFLDEVVSSVTLPL